MYFWLKISYNLISEFTKYLLKSEAAETWRDLADPDGKLLAPEKILETFRKFLSDSIAELNESKKYDNFK